MKIIEHIPAPFRIAIGDEVCFRPKAQRAWFWYDNCRTGCEYHNDTRQYGNADIEARTGIVRAIIPTEHGQDVILDNVWSNRAQSYVTARMSIKRVWPTEATIQKMWNRASDADKLIAIENTDVPDATPIKITRQNQAFICSVVDNVYTIPEYIRDGNGKIYKVVRIENNAFRTMKFPSGGVHIGNTVSEIGSYAFAETNITNLSGGNGLTRIEHNAFTHVDIRKQSSDGFTSLSREKAKEQWGIDVDKLEIGRCAFDF